LGLIGDHQGDDDDADGGLSPPPGFLDTLVRQNLRLLHFAQEALLLLLLGVASNMVAFAFGINPSPNPNPSPSPNPNPNPSPSP
jgi:hypothetical protein